MTQKKCVNGNHLLIILTHFVFDTEKINLTILFFMNFRYVIYNECDYYT
jgi:hypothetical protein